MARVSVGEKTWEVSDRVAKIVTRLADADRQLSEPESVCVVIDCKDRGVKAKMTCALVESGRPVRR